MDSRPGAQEEERSMNASPDSLRRPTSYKRDLERLEVRATHLSRRVESLELERDALKWRLHVAQRQLLDKP